MIALHGPIFMYEQIRAFINLQIIKIEKAFCSTTNNANYPIFMCQDFCNFKFLAPEQLL